MFIISMAMMVSKCIAMSQPVCVRAQSLSCVRLFVTPWSVACQAPSFMGFSRQEYWSGLPFPTPGDLPNPGIKSVSFASPVLAGRFFTTASPGKPYVTTYQMHTLKVCSLLSDKCASIKLSF